MKNSERMQIIIIILRDNGCYDLAEILNQTVDDFPDYAEQIISPNEFVDDLITILEGLEPGRFENQVAWDSERVEQQIAICDQISTQASMLKELIYIQEGVVKIRSFKNIYVA